MTQKNITTNQNHSALLIKRMFIGAAIGLLLISLFLLAAGEPDPAWGKLWRIKPLLIVPAAGAMGGLFSYFMEPLRQSGGWKTALAIILSLVVFFIGLWLGFVLGLNGTYWD